MIQVNGNFVKVQTNKDEIYLVGFGDLHAGNDQYDEKKAEQVRNFIKNKNCYFIGMGDLFENSSKMSPGAGVYQQTMTPREQRKYLVDFFEPIKNKCIGLLDGNHEYRLMNSQGDLYIEILADILKVPYLGVEAFGVITNSKRAYSFYANHTNTARKTSGLASNASERNVVKFLGSIEIYLRAHCHFLDFTPLTFFDVDKRNSQVLQVDRAMVTTGAYLKRPCYLAQKPTAPTKTGTVALKLIMDRNQPKRMEPVYLT
ncbi:MAG: hypothetical protein ACOC80_07550 [Petrotogales bacterium]